MKKLQLHDNSNKSAVLSITVVLNQQYMCTKGPEEQLNYYFTSGFLVIQEVLSI